MGVGNFFARIPDQLLHESELFGSRRIPSAVLPPCSIRTPKFSSSPLKTPGCRTTHRHGDRQPPFATSRLPTPNTPIRSCPFKTISLSSLSTSSSGRIAGLHQLALHADSLDVRARRAMAARADLVAAIRLPDDTFRKTPTRPSPPTSCFPQATSNEPQPEHPVWIDSVSHIVPGYGDPAAVNYNAYFDEHPEMVLGVTVRKAGCTGGKITRSSPLKATQASSTSSGSYRDLTGKFFTPYDRLSPRIRGTAEVHPRLFPHLTHQESLYFITKAPSGSTTMAHGLRSTRIVEWRVLFQLKSLVALRDSLKEVIRLQLQSANEGQLAECQEQLLQHYEAIAQTLARSTMSAQQSL